jgi:hypothetical protein
MDADPKTMNQEPTSPASDDAPCSPSSDTPETDVKVKRICGNWNNAGDQVQEFVFADVARKLEHERNQLRCELVTLRVAAQAVIDRWDTPLWKDVEPTGRVINRLRNAFSENDEVSHGDGSATPKSLKP